MEEVSSSVQSTIIKIGIGLGTGDSEREQQHPDQEAFGCS